MKIKIQSTSTVSSNGVKMVVFGGSGVGKTVLCSTAPDPFIISAERGLLSLANLDLPFAEVRTIAEIGEAYIYARDSKHDTICVDSLSEIGENVLEDFKKGVADGRQAYMKLAQAVGALIKNFRDIPDKHVVFISKMKREEDEDSGVVTYVPYMPGKVLPFNMPYLVDEVFCMRIDRKGNRYLQTAADRYRYCKDRSGKLEAEEPADLAAIIEKITKHK